ncbi:tigger transposable element-derived protein 1-like [Discoglossus pictus]
MQPPGALLSPGSWLLMVAFTSATTSSAAASLGAPNPVLLRCLSAKRNKGKRQSIPLDVKIQLLDRLEKGEPQMNIGADLHLLTSAIHPILKNKDKIRTSTMTSTASLAKKITCSRCYDLEEMEKKLSIWIDNQLERNMSLSQAIVMEKVKSIYSHIQSQYPDVTESFPARTGWFERFKKRYNLYNIKTTGEAASADIEAAVAFPVSFKDLVDRGSYPLVLVFNVDETGLF